DLTLRSRELPGDRIRWDRPIRDALTVRRDLRLDRVAGKQQPRFAARRVDDPQVAEEAPPVRSERRFTNTEHNSTAIGKPRRVEALCREAAPRLTGASHHQQSAAVALGAEYDGFAVGRERRHGVAGGGIVRQVDGGLT